jgi:hypothetical protein
MKITVAMGGSFGLIFALCIMCINIYNAKLSPIYTNESQSNYKFERIVFISILKGAIYGATFPISPLIIAFTWFNNSHFIPYSVYFNN